MPAAERVESGKTSLSPNELLAGCGVLLQAHLKTWKERVPCNRPVISGGENGSDAEAFSSSTDEPPPPFTVVKRYDYAFCIGLILCNAPTAASDYPIGVGDKEAILAICADTTGD